MPPSAPKLPPGVRRLFRLPKSRGRLVRDMGEELEAHLAMRAEELRRLGMSEADARAEARRRFGDANEFRDYTARRAGRRARRLGAVRWFAGAVQDMRVALRQLRRAPALAAVAVLTLAFCIGTTTAAYGVVRHLLLAPLPYPEGNRIVSLEVRISGDGEFHFNNLNAELVRIWAALLAPAANSLRYRQRVVHQLGERMLTPAIRDAPSSAIADRAVRAPPGD